MLKALGQRAGIWLQRLLSAHDLDAIGTPLDSASGGTEMDFSRAL
jgi:hypothetical protein